MAAPNTPPLDAIPCFPETCQAIHQKLDSCFPNSRITVEDNAWKHRHHREALAHPNKGHFKVIIASDNLAQQPTITAHRLVYRALNNLMPKIHALEIQVTPLNSTQDQGPL